MKTRFKASQNHQTRKKCSSKSTSRCKGSSQKHDCVIERLQRATRSSNFAIPARWNPRQYLKSIRRSQFLFSDHKLSKFLLDNSSSAQGLSLTCSSVWKSFEAVVQKYEFTEETSALAICIYFQYSIQRGSESRWNKKFIISVCLLLAAKAIELDLQIPRAEDFQFFCGQSYSQSETAELQLQILQLLCFEIQKSTVMTFVTFYLTCGIISEPQLMFCNKTIEELQQQTIELTFDFLKSGHFLMNEDYDCEIEAKKIITAVRERNQLPETNESLCDFLNLTIGDKQSRKSEQLKKAKSLNNLLNSSRSTSAYTQRNTIEPQKNNSKAPNAKLIVRKRDRSTHISKEVVRFKERGRQFLIESQTHYEKAKDCAIKRKPLKRTKEQTKTKTQVSTVQHFEPKLLSRRSSQKHILMEKDLKFVRNARDPNQKIVRETNCGKTLLKSKSTACGFSSAVYTNAPDSKDQKQGSIENPPKLEVKYCRNFPI